MGYDVLFSENLNEFNQDYLKYTSLVAKTCEDRDLSTDSMGIGTSAIIDTEIDDAHAGKFLAYLQEEFYRLNK